MLYRKYARQFKHYLQLQGIENKPAFGEDDYLKKWKQLSNRVEPYSYRLFSRYCGPDPNIVPEDIGHSIVEAVLNPERYRAYYSDKNMYGTYIPKKYLPRTVVRRINGSVLLDEDYACLRVSVDEALAGYSRVILKPTIDTCSGVGVMLFVKRGDRWCFAKDESVVLNEAFLMEYADDLIVQECLTQHEQLARLNPTSVNTLRIAAYRSVKDEKPHVLAAVVRIGKAGEFVDNAHSGGRFVGLDVSTGRLKDKALDQYGTEQSVWNDIDFGKTTLSVPAWERVIEMVEDVTTHIRHIRLIAFDISVDESGAPKLVEFNADWFSYWLFYFTHQNALGDYTDEIIEYCKSRLGQPRSAKLVGC